MYLSKKQIKALEIALEAMENHPTASYNNEQNDAINTIVAMINSARKTMRKYKKETPHD